MLGYSNSIAPSEILNISKNYFTSLNSYFLKGNKKSLEDVVGYSTMLTVAIAGGYLVISILNNEDYWKSGEGTPEEIKKRVSQRGLIASTFNVMLFGIVNGIVTVKSKADLATYQALIGMILAGLLGFILDNAIATEQGVSIFNGNSKSPQMENFGEAMKYGFGAIWSSRLPRYIITILLDIFVSLILTDAIIKYTRNWYFFRKHKSTHEILIMSFVAFTTFLAYANATRLEWAYPPTEQSYSKNDYIPTSTILLSSIISGMVFLVWNPISGPAEGIVRKSNKVLLITVLFVIIVICYYGNFLDPEPNQEIIQTVQNGNIVNSIINNKIEQGNSNYGIIIYLIFTIILVFATMYTSPCKFENSWWLLVFGVCCIITSPIFLTFIK